MLAVESLRDRHGEILLAEIARQHRCPGDRLQRGPMRARHDDEGDNHRQFSAAREHGAQGSENSA